MPTAQPVVIRRTTTTARAATVSVLVTAVLFGLLAWRLGFGAELPAFSALALIGVRLAMIDLAELRLPTALVLPLYQSWTAVLIGTVLAFLYANIAVLARIAKGRVIRHIPVPFGPVMLGGMFTAVLVPTF